MNVIGGSATPGLSINELVALSTDPERTQAALKLDNIGFKLGSEQGSLPLRHTIAKTYNQTLAHVDCDNILVANATSGSNHMVFQSLLSKGDHVICQYPIYGPCIEEPKYIGCDVSLLQLDAENGWTVELEKLEGMIRPGKTKLLVLNNPVNPTGTHFSTALQKDIIKICQKHNVILLCDEIFRPFFHTEDIPASFAEHADLGYDNVVVTSSLSKVYGGSGVRIGWICTRSEALRKKFLLYRHISCHSVSIIDETIAAEMLSPRCRTPILDKHLSWARINIAAIQNFVDSHSQYCDWVAPTAGAVGFIRFKDPQSGKPVNDVAFCERLIEAKQVMLAPATLCFEVKEAKEAFTGRVRVHFTCDPEKLRDGLASITEFLAENGTTSASDSVART